MSLDVISERNQESEQGSFVYDITDSGTNALMHKAKRIHNRFQEELFNSSRANRLTTTALSQDQQSAPALKRSSGLRNMHTLAGSASLMPRTRREEQIQEVIKVVANVMKVLPAKIESKAGSKPMHPLLKESNRRRMEQANNRQSDCPDPSTGSLTGST
jgi:hypothetical protein